MKHKKKTFTLTAVLLGKKAPDFGMGKGVIATQEIEFTDERDRGFNNPMFALARMEHEDRLTKELLRFDWKEKRKPKNKRKL